MRAGKLNKRIELQSSTDSTDTFGEPIKTWTTYDTVWASINPLSGNELIFAQQISSKTNIGIIIRYNSSVEVGDRVKYGTRYFDINAVLNEMENNKQLELLCNENL